MRILKCGKCGRETKTEYSGIKALSCSCGGLKKPVKDEPIIVTVPFSAVLCGAEILAERREMLCKKPPLCPDCQIDQVQLIEWIEGEVAEWKCRHCRVRFKFERAA